MTVTYTGSDSEQHQAEIGSGTVATGLATFNSEDTGTIDLTGATDAYLTLDLTPDGASSPALTAGGELTGTLAADILDGIDVDAEFALIESNYESGATTDPCDPLLFLPGTDVNGSSLTDEDVSCEAATGGGAMTLAELMSLATRYGPWIILALAGTLPDSYSPPATADPSQVTITPDQQTVHNVAQAILGQSQGKIDDETDAETAARYCLQNLPRAAGGLSNPASASCETSPIFFPGGDNPETTQNDYNGIFTTNTLDGEMHLGHMQLTKGTPDGVSSGWYTTYTGGTDNPCLSSQAGKSCDEYPFFSTTQAGPPSAALAMVDRGQNSSEGGYLGAFYRRCGITTGTNFLVIPMTSSAAPPTMYTCGT